MKKIKQLVLTTSVIGLLFSPWTFTTVNASETEDKQVAVNLTQFSSSQAAFVQSILQEAQELERQEGILTSVTLAQAILESNWGESGLSEQANNLFGIKGSYQGNSVDMQTTEYVNNEPIQTEATFRAYPDRAASVDDHAQLFVNGISGNTQQYAEVLGEKDYKKAAQAIQNAGYATDPAYAESLINTIETYHLDQYDQVYDAIEQDQQLLAYATISEPDDHQIWSAPYGTEGATLQGDAADYAGQQVEMIEKAVTKRATWYKIVQGDREIGWIDAKALTIFYTPDMEQAVKQKKYVAKTEQKIYRLPVEDPALVTGELKDYQGKRMKIDRKAEVSNETWYRITTNNGQEIGWTKADDLSSHK
ncbi:GW domain-containing glycosaminoglycan-binding protein [Listeria costaricensis]|uniref:GW domain-containing glycosaminoglycan-binding protein n=1 Tax=Listeria costaricensis TaxID=2026604 RepID=UPI001F09FD48|nr:GW domain-containing glycosaminoglycan-binding protein [Listeria costaricensis]